MDSFPNLDPNNLVIFYVVVTEKSLTAAAEKLFLTQPAVTYRIKSLEDYTRVKLIEIKKHQVILTPSGEELYKYAREVYQQLVSADRFVTAIRESNLRVGVASIYSAVVSPVLNAIFEEHYAESRLTVESGNAFEMVQSVADSRLDLAVVPKYDYVNSRLKNLEISPPMQLMCFTGKDQALNKQPLSWKELNDYPLVSGPQSSVVRRLVNEKFKSEGIEMRPLAAEVANVEWCINLVEHGHGLSFAFMKDIEKPVQEGRLIIVELTENLYLSAEAVMPADLIINPLMNKFIAMVKQAFSGFH